MQARGKWIFTKILKIIGWIVLSVVALLVVLALVIQIPVVQLKLTQKAVAFLEDKIGTEVSLQGIRIAFPKNIVLDGLYLEDQKGDTLLYAGKFEVNTDLWALTRNEIQLNHILLENTVAFIDRPEQDSAFNFTYILEAFAGDSTAVPDTLEQKGWDFSLETISLQNIRLRYEDLLEGNLARLAVGEFQLDMDEFDLANSTIRVGEISLAHTRGEFKQTKLPAITPPADDNAADSSAALIFSLNELAIEDVHLNYQQSALGQEMRADVGQIEIYADKIDLVNQEISLETVSMKRTLLAYQQHKADTVLPAKVEEESASGTDQTKPWTLMLAELDFEENSIQYSDDTKPHAKGTVDLNHLRLDGLSIDARDIHYAETVIGADLRNLSFAEQSGFAIKSLSGKVTVRETGATLEDFLLLTGNSRLQLQANAKFPSLKNIANTYPSARLSANINESFVNVRDILYFQPSFRDSLPLNVPANTNLQIDAAVRGSVNDLNIQHLVFRTLSDTYLRTSGTISGLPRPKDIQMNIALNKLYTSRADLESILPDTLLPDSIQLPAWINIEAGFRGTLQKGAFRSMLTSADGSIDVEGGMNLDSASAMRGLNAKMRVEDLRIGKILGKPDSLMGALAMQAEFHTSGLSKEEMNGRLTARIDRFDFQGYRYSGLTLDGTITDRVLSLAAAMKDENLDFVLDANYDFNKQTPRYNVSFDLRNADFQKLNFSHSPIRARGTLLVDMETSDFKILNGNVGIRKVAVFNGDDLYAIDSLLFASIDQKGRSEIKIDSDLLAASFTGSINLFGLPGVVREYFHTYYALDDSLDVRDAGRQHFSFNIQLKNTDLLTGLLVPKLTSFVPGEIKGEFDSEAQKLDVRMEIKEIQYDNIGVKSFVFNTHSDSRALKYDFIADKILVDSMRIDGLEFNGTVANDSIRTNLVILDSADREKYVLAGTFFSRDPGFEFRLVPKGIILNYQDWSVPANNYMRFGGQKFVAKNVQLVNLREKIIIDSKEQPGSPIFIGFRELNLEYLSSMIAGENPLAGLLQGDINFYPDTAGMTFTSDITVANLTIKKMLWGNLSLQVNQKVKNRFDVDFGLTGDENNVTATGFYLGGDAPAMDVTTRITQFRLVSLQPLLADQLQGLKGVISGEIRAKGTTDRPDIDGRILVNDTEFISTYLNTGFSIDEEVISFIDEGISFNAFEVADNNKNKARLDGTILTRNYRDFEFHLDLLTDHFRLFNTTREDNDLFYGKVDIEANARIRGNMATPIVNMEIGLSDGSDLTYIVPQSEASVLETEGIVKFVDKTFKGDPFMNKVNREASDTVKSTFRGIDFTAKIELSDKENFTIVIDPVTQDQLTISGNSTLTLKMDPTGDIQLAGRYEISEGTYNLSFYKFVKREFTMESGSTITWTGDPLNAEMDIRAIYEVETAPIELFSNQLTGSDPAEVNQYKQILPFLVYLDITGLLLQPEIAFKLEMPLDERDVFGGNVYARIQDINTRDSDLNKQVFALLILKRFIADNPFENKAAGGFESTARSSVSKILSEQLNRLSDKIKGVELSFDIKSYEDYTSGQAQGKTELQLGLSKSLLNDRLVVKLSGNVDIEGQNSSRDATDYIGDLALEYKVTPDGRFRITGFRNSNYDMIDGELTETGTGLIYVKDYNSLSELFKANAETRN
jgi:translocation and assembly module TamB